MFKSLSLVLALAVACNGQYVNSGSSNQGLNVLSSGSSVVQNDIQNAQAVGGGWGGYGGWSGYGGYGLDYPYGGYYPYSAGYAGAYAPYGAGYGYGHGYGHGYGYGGNNVNSQSNNIGANIMSTNSHVLQNGVQNAGAY